MVEVVEMSKILKILISILITISVAINPIATGFNVRSEAVAGGIIIEFIKYLAVKLAEGAAVGAAAYGLKEGTEAYVEWNKEVAATQNYAANLIGSENGVYLEISDGLVSDSKDTDGDGIADKFFREGQVYAQIGDTSTMTAEEKEFAEYFCNYVNSNEMILSGWGETADSLLNGTEITAEGYENVKNVVTNAYNNYLFEKAAQNEKINAAVNLEQALLDGNMPQYNFDFVGPSPTLDLGTISTNGAFTRDGYYHSLPITINPAANDGYYYYINEAQYSILENTNCYNNSEYPLTRALYLRDSGYYERVEYGKGSYNCSQYILYDGKIYYRCVDNAYRENASAFYSNFGRMYEPDCYVAVDGTNLSSTSFDPLQPFQIGFVANTEGMYRSSNPAFVAQYETNTIAAPSEEDFTTTTGGVLGLPFTAAETAIGNALNLGLLNPNSTLSLDENGEIVTADGIELAKLQELTELLAEGNLQFENIQQYLDLISKLISTGNMTEAEQKAILDNVYTQTKAQTKSLEDIKTAVVSISEIITTEGEVELETSDVSIIDRFPFCLPFDLYYIFSLLCTEAKEPIFKIPIQTTITNGGLNYKIDEEIVLDLTCFRLNGYDMVQIFTQSTTILLFIVCLIAATKRLMWK